MSPSPMTATRGQGIGRAVEVGACWLLGRCVHKGTAAAGSGMEETEEPAAGGSLGRCVVASLQLRPASAISL